ncbi:MAG: hypothetical protein LBR58_01315 [Propionibacteriaceae bacterium]|jgi:hypothetical protein|nr:hypothetical protein [Propionibacteriaceae bacterium]
MAEVPYGNLEFKAKYLPTAEFLATYPELAGGDAALLTKALWGSVTNKDIASRVATSNWLLDQGADAAHKRDDGCTVLHVFLAVRNRDPQAEAPLLRRLIEGGADINQRFSHKGKPLEALWAVYNFTDEYLAPFYDEFFRRPDLDLLDPGTIGANDLDRVRKLLPHRQALLERMEQYLRDHGLVEPPK